MAKENNLTKTTKMIQVLQDKKLIYNIEPPFFHCSDQLILVLLEENDQSSTNSQQDVWLQVSPLARPTYGYEDQGNFYFDFNFIQIFSIIGYNIPNSS